VCASVPRRARAGAGDSAGKSAPGGGGSGSSAPAFPPARMTRAELAVMTASLRELARRLGRFRDRLGELEAAVQPRSGSSSRSSRESRSSKRSRSS